MIIYKNNKLFYAYVTDTNSNGTRDLLWYDDQFNHIATVENAIFGFGITSCAESNKRYINNFDYDCTLYYGDEELYEERILVKNADHHQEVYPVTYDQIMEFAAGSPVQSKIQAQADIWDAI